MALKTLVKISGVNNLSDARYAAGMGVEFLGFNLDPHLDHYLTPDEFGAITGWVSGVKLVGELSGSDQSFTTLLDQYKLDYLQMSASRIDSFHDVPVPMIIKIDGGQIEFIQDTLEKHQHHAEYFLVEPDEPISAEALSFCQKQALHYPIILGSNIDTQSLENILASGFKGIALRGGTELRPGYKDFDQLAEILEALEKDD